MAGHIEVAREGSQDLVATPASSTGSTRARYSVPVVKSRNGCVECKKRRKKCDEKKPTCSSCRHAGTNCEYKLKLSWGGRAFRKSRFGDCLEVNAKKISNSSDGFVYGLESPNSEKALALHQEPQPEIAVNLSPPGFHMPHTGRLLLERFLSNSTRALSCHREIHSTLCRELVPMAFEKPHLLAAIMALASINCLSHGINEIDGRSVHFLISHLLYSSIQGFRNSVVTEPNSDATLATALMLCLCDIYSPDDHDHAWHVHLRGARAILSSDERQLSITSDEGQDSTRLLLDRMYVGIFTTAAVSTKRSSEIAEGPDPRLERLASPTFIDDFLAFSVDLIPILGRIGELASLAPKATSAVAQDIRDQAERLLLAVKDMIERDRLAPPPLRPSTPTATRATAREHADFLLSNAIHQHAVLLHIYRRLLRLPSNTPAVQSAVKYIVSCVQKMTREPGFSPWIVHTMPLFTAGVEAIDPGDREVLVNGLKELEGDIGARNIGRAREVVENVWKVRSERGDADGVTGWDELLDEKYWDVIAY